MALSKKHVDSVCKFGCGKETCSYLAMSADGFKCLKGTDLEATIKMRHAAGQMSAAGDNCPGKQEG